MTLEEHIAAANEAGFRINNLFQRQVLPGWQANLTDDKAYYDFGYGATPAEAMQMALAKALATVTKSDELDLLG